MKHNRFHFRCCQPPDRTHQLSGLFGLTASYSVILHEKFIAANKWEKKNMELIGIRRDLIVVVGWEGLDNGHWTTT